MFWYGRLDDVKFLKRLYNLSEMPSYDGRFKDAEGDIWQHTINNYDYDYDWIFFDDRFGLEKGTDEVFLKFICEMFHPAVLKQQVDDKETVEYVYFQEISRLLAADGYELVVKTKLSERPIFIWKDLLTKNIVIEKQVKTLTESFNSDYIKAQIIQMNDSIEKNPTDAIGKAKELIEICCKTVLERKGVTINKDWEVPRLMKEACKVLKLSPDDITNTAKASDTLKSILGNLAHIAHGMAELRNPYGTGHGKPESYKGLSPRHARLAVGAATTTVYFMWETYTKQD